MNGFEFKLNGQKITANEIDDKLEKSIDLNERKAVWEASKEIWAGVETEFGDAARSAKRRRQRDEVSRLLFAPGRCLRNDHRRDAQDAGRLDGDIASAVFATAYLGEIQARRKISPAGAEENSCALDQ